MFVELRVVSDEVEPQRVIAASGQLIHVGRLRHHNQLSVADPLMAPVHFSLTLGGDTPSVKDLNVGLQKHAACAGQCFTLGLRNVACLNSCKLNDCSGNLGLWVNGKKVRQVVVQHSDIVMAGTTLFQVVFSEAAPELPSPSLAAGKLIKAGQQRLLELLAAQKLPLFAIVDAARSPALLGLLRTHTNVYYSLYDGAAGEKLDDVAPYLVELPARSLLTEAIVREQWGNSWGVFLSARSDFKTLRQQLRRLLMIEDPRGKQMYFRFYDPRVLRSFLPTCTREQAADLFGPVSCFLMESFEATSALVCSVHRVERIVLEE